MYKILIVAYLLFVNPKIHRSLHRAAILFYLPQTQPRVWFSMKKWNALDWYFKLTFLLKTFDTDN